MSLGLSAYGSKYVLCWLGGGGGGTCSCCFLMATSGGTQNHWRTFPCWLCETNSSLSGFSGDRKRECGLYTLMGRTLHVETKFVLLQTSGRHDGARAHGNLWSPLSTNNAAGRLHWDPIACSPCWAVQTIYPQASSLHPCWELEKLSFILWFLPAWRRTEISVESWRSVLTPPSEG